ncbi:para-aminobenzoate synthetase / 4-amino-4-deoxychorismate lyase [Gracilibacillus orientalis]|uniref:Para-aminobenzoate synthetase / 4-amino-4-deoxychorismate lyase n=1 Tax=Gracilibacillus orientalis TaxID=334253 RepID=A0A1I4QHW7_9BACI|nr:aminodeoxychorismate synthase component I [Gracilibacillus orientalis]SFM39614.1 para-aminobenzoate synthetase / 4-amino-4-deoxychorismate lyase [Gracilibacillus orientalis]
MNKNFLQFNFQHTVRQFTNPIKVWNTNSMNEIPIIFEELEQFLDNGYYIAGFVSYEAAPAFDPSYHVHEHNKLPLIWLAAYEKPADNTNHLEDLDYHLSDWKHTTSYEDYQVNIEHIKKAIEDGNTYQVNYTTRLEAHFTGNPYAFYQQLVKNQAASYCAYLDIGSNQILSASPELFFKVKDGKIITKPMKGTMKRGRTYEEDLQFKQELRHSAKDQAENVMIVDLLRNDMGQIAKPGTVQVKSLFDIETYPTVHQMTSTIEASLEKMKVYDWFKALFPCGSITGAPKVETMKYIAELEDSPRGVYCGAIGWISPEREATFNVPIRTVNVNGNNAIYGTGGGITWDSTSFNEYHELNQKAEILHQKRKVVSLLESMKLDNGYYPLMSYHLQRLKHSSQYFGYPFHEERVKEKLFMLADQYQDGCYKVRLLYHPSSHIELELQPVKKLKEPIQTVIASKPIDKRDIYLYHKTTNRELYQKLDQNKPSHVLSSLLWNKEGHITEFTIGNVVVEKEDRFFTPPVLDGLLPGTYREQLIEEKVLIEKSIPLSVLGEYDQIWFINSVRGWVKVQLVE